MQIHERLAPRADVSLIHLGDGSRKDAAARREALNDADVAILCLPDDAAQESVSLIDSDTVVIEVGEKRGCIQNNGRVDNDLRLSD